MTRKGRLGKRLVTKCTRTEFGHNDEEQRTLKIWQMSPVGTAKVKFLPILVHFGPKTHRLCIDLAPFMINTGPNLPSNFNDFEISLKMCF